MVQTLKNIFKAYFLTGLLVLGPLVISAYIIKLIIDAADSALVSGRWSPIPGFGVVIAVAIILFAGFLGKNVIGRYLFRGAGDLVARIPLIGGVYSSTRQVLETLLGGENQKFGRVVLIQYPSSESWSLAFVTGEEAPPEVQSLFAEKIVSVYVPTTPNPTSGFYLHVPLSKTRETTLTVEAAFKTILSLGLAGHGN